MDKFCHLHVHSEYSSLDGFAQIKNIVKRVKDIGQPAIAITDHGNLNGCYKFYKACKEADIKPILGIEFYAVETYEHSRPYHLTVLAKNTKGWKNLLALHEISYKNFYYKQRISFKDLFAHKEGLLVLTGCPSGIMSKHIRNHEIQKAEENLILFKSEIEDLYVELMFHGLDFQEELNHNLVSLAKKHGLKTVYTNDSHYCNKEDAVYQDYLMCDQLKTTIHQDKKIGLTTDEFYIKTREQMPGSEEQKDVTLEIADKCNVDIHFKGFLLPKVDNQDEDFIRLIKEGIAKYELEDKEEYLLRLRSEYKIIKEANLIGYFLIVYDFMKFCKDSKILVGPGRGSVGGCLIGYLLGIHSVDPIKHKLLFSRFYNAGRKKSLPDIDIDFPENQIHRVREYVKNKYGEEKVAHIGTYTYLQSKSALKLVCRVMGVDFKTANEYSNIINDEKETKELLKSSDSFKDIVRKTEKFKGLATHSSIHAAGMIISPVNLKEKIPLRINKDNGIYVSNWDMKDIEEIGLVKFDFLSLNTLDIIQDTLNAVDLKLEDIPLDDDLAFEKITTTNNVGIFQLSSDGISKVANDMKVKSIDDIAVVVALYRPGPISSGLHHKYIHRKDGIEPIVYAHRLLESVLADTYGLFIFQEQVIAAVMVLANFTESEADLLRKAIGKKIPKLMKQQRSKFLKGCNVNEIDSDLAEDIWDEIQEFAEYCFNRAHSVEYGYITYYTAYLKAHYPYDYMAALLNNNYSNAKKLALYLKECTALDIEVIPPSLTKGSYDFIAKDKKIIFGTKGIGGIGEKTAKEINSQNYKSFEDFCAKYRPSSDILIALAEAGAFDEFGYKRNQIIQSSNKISEMIKSRKRNLNPKAKSLFSHEAKFDIADVEELPNSILANKEYERLNTYLMYNPLKNMSLITPVSLNGNIFIEGYIIDIREHLTKNKETMAFLTVATMLGSIEALVFPYLYREKKKEIKANIYVAIEGTYDDKLLVKKIWRKNV